MVAIRGNPVKKRLFTEIAFNAGCFRHIIDVGLDNIGFTLQHHFQEQGPGCATHAANPDHKMMQYLAGMTVLLLDSANRAARLQAKVSDDGFQKLQQVGDRQAFRVKIEW